MASESHVVVRRAEAAEAEAAARVLIESRRSAEPAIPPSIHADDDVVAWFCDQVMASMEVWVAVVDARIVGVMALSAGWIEQLYIEWGHTGRGIGSELVDRAKREAAATLDLWTFASNVGAQRFYLRHGFVEVERTDGANEEGEPDIRYRWSR